MKSTLVSAPVLLLLLAITPMGSGQAFAGEVETLVQDMLEGIGAQVVDCPATEVPYARERVCAEFSPTLYAFRSQWNERMDEAQPASLAESLGDWTMGWGTCCYRDYRVGDGSFRVTLDFHARQVDIIYRENRPTSSVVSKPMVVDRSEPRYPTQAKKEKITGRVAVEVVVGSDGSVNDAKLVWACPQGYELESAAIDAVRNWKFEPATQDGQPLEASTVVVVEFRRHLRGKGKTTDIAASQPPVMGSVTSGR
jgi:TonB family protein